MSTPSSRPTITAPVSAAAPPVLPLAGQVAFVTGGSRGIGAAIVRRLACDGANVVFSFQHDGDAADALTRQIEAAGGRAVSIRVDSAGVGILKPIDETSLAEIDQTLAVNVRAPAVAAQAAAPHLQAAGGGRIVMIGSCNAERAPAPGFAVYAMSKSALVGLVKGLARDLGPSGITVNNVQPGPVDTDMNPADGGAAGFQHGLMAQPRHAHPDEIAAMVAYLVSAEAAFVTGASLLIDGGFSA